MNEKCPRCNHNMEPDADQATFKGYCRNCGFRSRIGSTGDPLKTAYADPGNAEWRRAHGFPE